MEVVRKLGYEPFELPLADSADATPKDKPKEKSKSKRTKQKAEDGGAATKGARGYTTPGWEQVKTESRPHASGAASTAAEEDGDVIDLDAMEGEL